MRMLKIFLQIVILTSSLSVLFSCSNDEAVKPTKNVIFMVPDGMSTSMLSAAEWYRRYVEDDMDYQLAMNECISGMVQQTMSNGVVVCSAASMSGMVTGVPQQAGNLSVYPLPDPAQDIIEVDPQKSGQPLATVFEAARLNKSKAIGMVATFYFNHATPAACVSHTLSRRDFHQIKYQMASNYVDVMFGGGCGYVDDEFKKILEENDITLLQDDLEAFRSYEGDKLWSLYNYGMMTYDVDRDPDKEPSLAEMTKKAIDILSRDEDGFFLMVEGSQIDRGGHANDAMGVISEVLAFDDAVRVALDFAKKDGNTTVIIAPDHGTSAMTLGDKGFRNYTSKGLDSVFVRIKDFNGTVDHVAARINATDTPDVKAIVKEVLNLDFTDEECAEILSRKSYVEGNYMEVSHSRNMIAAISNYTNKRLHIGFLSGNHTGENVILGLYHPEGDIMTGVITNVELNEYICDVLGLDESLDEITQRQFVKHTTLFDGYEYDMDLSDEFFPKLIVKDGDEEMVITANRSKVEYDGETYSLSTPVVCITTENMEAPYFYAPKEVLEIFKK